MKPIYIIDSFSKYAFHEMFNAGLLAECMCISDRIYYYAGKSSIISLKNMLPHRKPDNIIFKQILVIEGNRKICTLLRFIVSMVYNIILLLIIHKDALIIYNYNNIFSLPLINFLNKYLKKKIVVFCHGEFEVFNNVAVKDINIFWKFHGRKVKQFFSNNIFGISKSLVFFVLGDNIRNNLKKYVSDNVFEKIYSVEHPYISGFHKMKRREETKINIGMVGQARKGKNIENYITIAKMFSEEILNGRIAFSIVGSVDINRNEIKEEKIDIPLNRSNLSRKEFENEIANLDYVVFFYNKDRYRYTASGPFFDALNFEKPIISLRNEYFEYMFNKYGAFGILVDSIEEMGIYIRDLLKNRAVLQFAFNEIKNVLSPENLALQFKTELEKAGVM
ncbi:hypothetical protein FACS1894147_04880 [Spirochaetia bacterium]|nr:hypothetical protein FACS1894147_04880 [Spirochaetia bacterium]